MASCSDNGNPSSSALRRHEEEGSEGHTFIDLHSVYSVLEEDSKVAWMMRKPITMEDCLSGPDKELLNGNVQEKMASSHCHGE